MQWARHWARCKRFSGILLRKSAAKSACTRSRWSGGVQKVEDLLIGPKWTQVVEIAKLEAQFSDGIEENWSALADDFRTLLLLDSGEVPQTGVYYW